MLTADYQRVALVTGANKGIGREIVQQLSSQGFHVFLGARSESLGNAAALGIGPSAAGDVAYLPLDVSNGDSVHSAAEFIKKKFGRLDALVSPALLPIESDKMNGLRVDAVRAGSSSFLSCRS